jgi:hypothetical protein
MQMSWKNANIFHLNTDKQLEIDWQVRLCRLIPADVRINLAVE